MSLREQPRVAAELPRLEHHPEVGLVGLRERTLRDGIEPLREEVVVGDGQCDETIGAGKRDPTDGRIDVVAVKRLPDPRSLDGEHEGLPGHLLVSDMGREAGTVADEPRARIVEQPQAAELLAEKCVSVGIGIDPVVPEPTGQSVVAGGEVPAVGDAGSVAGRIAGRSERGVGGDPEQGHRVLGKEGRVAPGGVPERDVIPHNAATAEIDIDAGGDRPPRRRPAREAVDEGGRRRRVKRRKRRHEPGERLRRRRLRRPRGMDPYVPDDVAGGQLMEVSCHNPQAQPCLAAGGIGERRDPAIAEAIEISW